MCEFETQSEAHAVSLSKRLNHHSSVLVRSRKGFECGLHFVFLFFQNYVNAVLKSQKKYVVFSLSNFDDDIVFHYQGFTLSVNST